MTQINKDDAYGMQIGEQHNYFAPVNHIQTNTEPSSIRTLASNVDSPPQQELNPLQKIVTEFLSNQSPSKEQAIHFSAMFENTIVHELTQFSFATDETVTLKALEDKITLMRPYRNLYLDALEHLIANTDNSDKFAIVVIEQFLQNISTKPYPTTGHKEHYTFFLWDIFLSTVAMMLFYEKYSALGNLLTKKFLSRRRQVMCDYYDEIEFPELREHMPILGSLDHQHNYYYVAKLLLDEERAPSVTRGSLTTADVILCQISHCYGYWEKFEVWYPDTLAFYSINSLMIDFWKDMKSLENCEKKLKIFRVQDVHNLRQVIENNQFNKEMYEVHVRHIHVPYIAEFITFEDVASEA